MGYKLPKIKLPKTDPDRATIHAAIPGSAIFDELRKKHETAYGTISERLGTAGGTTAKEDKGIDQSQQDIMDIFAELTPPDLSPVKYQKAADVGKYRVGLQKQSDVLSSYGDVDYALIDPELYSAVSQGSSEMNNISVDPQYLAAQNQSLSALQDIISGGGLNAQDKANLSKIQSDVNAQDRGRRGAIMQNAQARGMAGGGMELLQQLQSSQDATGRQSQADLDIAGMSQARQLDAILKSGALGQSIERQQFDQQSEVAKANDIINQFNASNTNDAARINAATKNTVASQNAANQYTAATGNRANALDTDKFNINNKNTVNANNTATSNQGKMYNLDSSRQQNQFNTNIANEQTKFNAGIPQQQFMNQVTVAQGKAGALGGQVESLEQRAQRKATEEREKRQAIIGGGTAAASAAAGAKK